MTHRRQASHSPNGVLDRWPPPRPCARGEGIAARSVVDLVDGLVAKSILAHAAGNAKARYRLLDTIGEFGLQKRRAKGNERPFRSRHRDSRRT